MIPRALRLVAGSCVLLATAAASAQTQPAQPAPPAQPAQTQPSAPPWRQLTVVLLPFRGRATQDLIQDAENAVREALTAHGVTVPDAVAVQMNLGVDAPRDPTSIAGFGRTMRATHVITGEVQPFAGQYNLSLTVVEASSARSARREENVGDTNDQAAINRLLDGLFDPSALGAAPVDPEEERRRLEAERRRQEDEARARADRERQEAERRRREEEERQRRLDAESPVRAFDAGGPVGLGAGLSFGGLLSGGRPAPTGAVSGTQPSDPSSLAFALRIEGAYALSAAPGLELAGAAMLMLSPTTAFGLGVGAQYNFPASSRSRFRGTGGARVGLFQGVSGARITTVWIDVFARAEFLITPGVAVFAGLELDAAPGDNGGVTALSASAGVRLRLGGAR